MKITNDSITAALGKVNTPDTGKKEPAPAVNSPSPGPTGTSVKDKMVSLFARIGISPDMPLNDSKLRRQIIERRRQIRDMQRIGNLQAVLSIAMNVSVAEREAESLDPDWFYTFAEMAENIYSPAMQELWGKIFAVEVSHPGSFSLRSLETLRALTQRDAKLFGKAVTVASRRQGDAVPRILVGYHVRKGWLSLLTPSAPTQLNLSAYGLSYPDLLALIDMKLIYASEIESGEFAAGQPTHWRCGNASVTLSARRAGVALVYYKFTAVGAELYKLVSKQDNSQYLSALSELLAPAFDVDQPSQN
ncbi:TIGR03899 family protein [Alteromonas sp. ASW11-19]|uniref:TIGR03899 family protein n=1 Tax=Alteromonas salexigens TaxID=2982530 RepID=A0ABT2VL54_9ALTE|nr:TIGR03899 family protein [Alteromonas salexigens]MCU7553764.1 TIGR03899 family protein [Alteromonas salexigens]